MRNIRHQLQLGRTNTTDDDDDNYDDSGPSTLSDKHFLKINKYHGTQEDIDNCATTFLNRCVIMSPKIIYGLNILINYDNIHCFYKHTSTPCSMSALEYHQQYSRACNCKHVHIYDLNPSYEQANIQRIDYETHVSELTSWTEFKMNRYTTFCNPQNNPHLKWSSEIQELYSSPDLHTGALKLDPSKPFAAIHLYKTWFDSQLTRGKLQFVSRLAEEAGYSVKYEYYNIMVPDKPKKSILKNNMLTSDQIKIDRIYDDIEKGHDNPRILDKYSNMYSNVKDFIGRRISKLREIAKSVAMRRFGEVMDAFLYGDNFGSRGKFISGGNGDSNDSNGNDDNEIKLFRTLVYDTINNIMVTKRHVLSDKMFNFLCCANYFHKSRGEFAAICQDKINKDLIEIGVDNLWINKMMMLFKIEEILGIKRFDVEGILEEDWREKKEQIEELCDDLHVFLISVKSNETKSFLMKKRLEKIDRYDQFKKFVAEIYNTFGPIFRWTKKTIRTKVHSSNYCGT